MNIIALTFGVSFLTLISYTGINLVRTIRASLNKEALT